MNLTPGDCLNGGERTSFEVIEAAWETPRHTFYRARKTFWNLRFPAWGLEEAAEDEGLQVLVRVPRPGAGGDLSNPADRPRAGLVFELETVLQAPLLPGFVEPLDVLDPPADTPAGSAPLLVLAEPHGERLPALLSRKDGSPERLARFSVELLGLLDALHGRGLAAGGLDPVDFLIGQTGRWFHLGTDRISATTSPDSCRADLADWAAFVLQVVPGVAPADGPPRTADLRWLSSLIERCLTPDPRDHPSSVADLMRDPPRWLRRLGSLRRTLFGPRKPPPEATPD